ncbi:MAG: S1C family serine protease [Hyphomicrobiales bacterium]
MRAFALAAGLALSMVLVAGCGGGDDDDSEAGSTSTAKPAESASPATLTSEQIVEQLTGSVVRVDATYPEGSGGGSGVVWEQPDRVLTNAHVVLGAGAIKIIDPNDGRALPAKVIALSPCDDLALLSVDRANLKPAKIGSSKALKTGEEVVALGFPSSYTDTTRQLTVTRGIVSKLGDRLNGLQDLIVTDAAINPGNSGGPLVNLHGEVIGINSLTSRVQQSTNYAIASDEAKFVSERLKEGKNLDYLGARLEQNYRGLAEELGIQLAYIDGLLVTGVDAGSPADKAQLVYSDLIYELDDVPVETVGDVCDVLRSRKAGDNVRVEFVRTYTDGSFDEFYTDVTLE